MRIQQLKDFKQIGVIEIQDNQILSGSFPDFLQDSLKDAIRKGRLESVVRYYCNGISNLYELRDGEGLIILGEAPTLDADDEPDLSNLITDRALKPTKAAIATWIKTIKKQIDAWKNDGLTLTEIRDRIPTLYGSLSSDAFAKTLTQSIQVSYLGSRAEILDETAADGNAEEETL